MLIAQSWERALDQLGILSQVQSNLMKTDYIFRKGWEIHYFQAKQVFLAVCE